jgi:hypothetical protein
MNPPGAQYLLRIFQELFCQLIELEFGIPLTRQRQCDNRHIVYVARFDEKRVGARRQKVLIGHELVIQVHEAPLHRLADIKAYDDERPARARDRIDVFDGLDFGQLSLKGLG